MKKSDILKKISEQVARGILNPNAGEPVGLKITKQALKKSKKENEDYYKALDKKFTDYLKMGGKDEVSPKINMTDEERKMYYGTGMEGLKYDDEGTPKYEKFVKRNEELNKPSKDYYLDKDEVDDSYDRIMKDGKAYKKHKYEKPDEYQKTPKLRVTKESVNKKTMKQLNFKKPFITQERVMKLIPESFKVNGNKFKMSDGIETYTIKWEGNTKTGTPTPLQYKNGTLIKEDVSKMKHLYDYNSQDTLMKTNDALTENQIFAELLGKSRLLKEQDTTTTPTGTTPTSTTKPTGVVTTIERWSTPEAKKVNNLFMSEFLPTLTPNREKLTSLEYADKLKALSDQQLTGVIKFFTDKGYKQPNENIKKFQQDVLKISGIDKYTNKENITKEFNDGVFGVATAKAIIGTFIETLTRVGAKDPNKLVGNIFSDGTKSITDPNKIHTTTQAPTKSAKKGIDINVGTQKISK